MSDLVVKDQNAPAQLLSLAVEKGASIEMLEKLMALQERHEANNARKAYHAAMAAFKANPPTIVKNKVVDFGNKTGGRTSYRHADLAEASAIIGEALSRHGLSAAWRTEQGADGKGVTVICEITHVLGHTERTSLTAAPDTSGTKNSIQAIASTVTYLERYTLLALTGLAARDMDSDGEGTEDVAVITAGQAADLQSLIDEVKADKTKFCAFFKVESIESLPATDYKKAIVQLEAKRKRGTA